MVEKHQPHEQIDHPSRERRIREYAARQAGQLTRAQLLACGLTRGGITGRVSAGQYVVMYAGVYAIAPARDDPVARAWAAVLACGDHAVLSHLSAAALWGMVHPWPSILDVTAPVKRARPGIRTHRSTALQRPHVDRNLGVPVTSRARTVLDIAPDLPGNQLRRIVNDQRREGLLRDAALKQVTDRLPCHPGAQRVQALLTAASQRGPTRSEFEDRFLLLVADYGLPTPLVNTKLTGFEVDILFPDHKVIVELDGWDFHRSPEQFARDRERDAVHLAQGIVTLRVTWDRIVQAPAREAARLEEILRSRAP
jgi:hypothetical protein